MWLQTDATVCAQGLVYVNLIRLSLLDLWFTHYIFNTISDICFNIDKLCENYFPFPHI